MEWTAGSVREKQVKGEGTWEVQPHRVKHLHDSAGMPEKVASKKPTRISRRDKNVESGVGEVIMTPSRLHSDSNSRQSGVYGVTENNNRKEQYNKKSANIRRKNKNIESREQDHRAGGRKTMLTATPKSGGYKVLKFRAPPPPSPNVKGVSRPPPPPSVPASSTPARGVASK